MARNARFPVMVYLTREDFETLSAVCEERGQSRADFLRSALKVHERIPAEKTRPLTGACLERHLARLEREKREKRKRGARKRRA